MNKQLTCCSINEMIFTLGQELMLHGRSIESRNGGCLELDDVDVYITNPRARHLYLTGRKNNIFATLGEVFWVFANKPLLDPFLTFFLKRAIDYSDDGLTWPDYYGSRIWTNDQIGNVLDMFGQDGINTRRAIITIWRPDMDTISVRGPVKSKAIPCSNGLWFWVRDGKFNCKFQMRSNDIIFGTTINIAEFTILQEIIMRMLNNRYGYGLELGYFHYSAISTHIYEPYFEQMREIITNIPQPLEPGAIDNIILPFIDTADLYNFISDIYEHLLSTLTGNGKYLDITQCFNNYGVPTQNNILYQYAIIVDDYIRVKKHQNLMQYGNSSICGDLLTAVNNNYSRPVGLEWKD